MRQSRAIDLHKWPVGAVGLFVYETGDDFLANTGLTKYQYRNIRAGDVSSDIDNPKHLRIRRQNIPLLDVCQLLFERFDFFLEPLFFEHVIDFEFQRFFFERLCEVAGGADLHGFNHRFDLANARQGDDRNRRINGLEV